MNHNITTFLTMTVYSLTMLEGKNKAIVSLTCSLACLCTYMFFGTCKFTNNSQILYKFFLVKIQTTQWTMVKDYLWMSSYVAWYFYLGCLQHTKFNLVLINFLLCFLCFFHHDSMFKKWINSGKLWINYWSSKSWASMLKIFIIFVSVETEIDLNLK